MICNIDILSFLDRHASVVQWWLLSAEALATVAVAWGITFESDDYPKDTHKIASSLVLWGVAIETMSSVALFTFDEHTSHNQQVIIDKQNETIMTQNGKIIKLEQKIAPRLLTQSQIENISEKMNKFKKFTSIFSVIPTSFNSEPITLADQLVKALGPKAERPQNLSPYAISGIGIWITNSSTAHAVGEALVDALDKEGLYSYIMPEKLSEDCADNDPKKIDWCSRVVVLVGDHP